MNYAKAMKDPKARAAYNKSKGVKAGKKGAASKICQHVLKEDDWCLGGVSN